MLIDLEKKFGEYLHELMHDGSLEEDALEEKAPDLYLKWLDMPADWLSGKSPNGYFEAMDAAALIASLGAYMLADIPVPGALLNCIADKHDDTYSLLLSLMRNYEGEKADAMKAAVVRLIEEMDMPRPFDYYIETVAASTEQSQFSEACVDELKNAGEAFKNSMIAAYEKAQSPYSADCFLDILADMPFDARVFELTLEQFLYSETNKAFYASCLGKLGSEKALPYLEDALKQEGIKYFDYISIKNAMEALGAEVQIDRDFSGDNDYDSLINMGE